MSRLAGQVQDCAPAFKWRFCVSCGPRSVCLHTCRHLIGVWDGMMYADTDLSCTFLLMLMRTT